jgi:hypothetical protein
MDEIKIIIGEPSVFYVGKTKVSVKVPSGVWVAQAFGMLKNIGLIGNELLTKGTAGPATLWSLRHIFKTIKVSGRPGPLKWIWFFRLGYKTQIAFIEQWLQAIDIKTIKDFFARWGKEGKQSTPSL